MKESEYRQFCKLQEQVREAGFPPDIDQALREEVKIRQQHFHIDCTNWGQTSDDRTWYRLSFYKLDGGEDFTLDHYTALFRKPIIIPDVRIKGISLSGLEDRMKMIDWNFVRQSEHSKDIFVASDETITDMIGGIIDDLEVLARTEQGRRLSDLLETKYLSDTLPVLQLPIQQKYDKINSEYIVEYNVPVKGTDTVPRHLLSDIFNSGEPLPPVFQKKHEVYKVATVGYRPIDTKRRTEFDRVKDERFFSNLQGAVKYIEEHKLESFQPIHMIRGKSDFTYKRMVITEDVKDISVAEKTGVWHPLAAIDTDSNVVQWELNREFISVDEFEKKSGLKISEFGISPDNVNAFQVFPKVNNQPDIRKAIKSKSTLKPDKGMGL